MEQLVWHAETCSEILGVKLIPAENILLTEVAQPFSSREDFKILINYVYVFDFHRRCLIFNWKPLGFIEKPQFLLLCIPVNWVISCYKLLFLFHIFVFPKKIMVSSLINI